MPPDALAIAPLLVPLAAAPVAFVGARALRGPRASWTGLGTFGALAAAFALAAWLKASGIEGRVPIGAATLEAGGLAYFLALLTTGLGMATALFSIRYLRGGKDVERYYPLLLLMIAGAMGIGFATDLFGMFVFFELMAIASYGLVAYEVDRAEALEAGMKYVIMSGAGSLVALFGISLVYYGAGTLDLEAIRTGASVPVLLAVPAIALLVVGFGLKSAIAPMHTWLPDAHTAAPSGISAMLSGIVIEAALIALARGLLVFAGPAGPAVAAGLLVAVLAVVTMTVGNLLALPQTDLKRMLAFSSVAQVGYILLGFALFFEYGVRAGLDGGLFHILNHALMKGGAFLAAGAFLWVAGTRDLAGLAGVGRTAPAVGASFAVFVLGLAGVPPMAGFLSKLLIARAGLDAGGLVPLLFVVALAVNSVLSLGYYVPALQRIVFAESEATRPRVPWTMQAPIVALAILTIAFGLFPDIAVSLASAAGDGLAGMVGGA